MMSIQEINKEESVFKNEKQMSNDNNSPLGVRGFI